MKAVKPISLVATIACLLFLMGCEIQKASPGPTLYGNGPQKTHSSGASVPVSSGNPASKNCIVQGGRLDIKKNPSGGEYGVCYFEDNRMCEEWALMNGNCPVGGRKITGYDNEAQSYCAITGGEVHMNNPKPDTCDLPTKAGTCSTDDYFTRGRDCLKK